MKEISILKAVPIGNDLIPDTRIIFDTQFPDFENLEKSDKHFENEASFLEKALHDILPGGTYDRLLVKMLDRRKSHFIVPFGGDS